jgi:hypothetical protein
MPTRILYGASTDDGHTKAAVMYDSVTMWAFGPIFDGGASDAEEFIEWLTAGPLEYRDGQLENLHAMWSRNRNEPCPDHICDVTCDEDPAVCPIYKRAVGYPGFTK